MASSGVHKSEIDFSGEPASVLVRLSSRERNSESAMRNKSSLHSKLNSLRFNTAATTAQCGFATVLALGGTDYEKSRGPRQRRGSGPSVLRIDWPTPKPLTPS